MVAQQAHHPARRYLARGEGADAKNNARNEAAVWSTAGTTTMNRTGDST